MKRSVIFLSLSLISNLFAGEFTPVAEWDFTKGSLKDSSGKYEFFLRGKSTLTEQGLHIVEAPSNVKNGAAAKTLFPELSPAAFRLTVTFTPSEKMPEKQGIFYLWDNKYYQTIPPKPTEAANHGFLLYLARLKNGTLRPTLGLGLGKASDFIVGKAFMPVKGKSHTLAVEYDGLQTIRFFLDGKLSVTRTTSIGGPISPAIFKTSVGDRITSLHCPFSGTIQRVKLEKQTIPAFSAVPDFRAAFRRGEKDANLDLLLTDYTGFTDAKVSVSGKDGILHGSYPVQFSGKNSKFRLQIPVETNLLPGTYPCTVSIRGTAGEKQIADEQKLNLFIGPRLHEGDQMRFFWLYPTPYFDEMKPMGFTHLTDGWWSSLNHKTEEFNPAHRKMRHDLLDKMLLNGLVYGEASALAHDRVYKKQFPRILKNGSKRDSNMDVSNPEALRKITGLAEKAAVQIGSHPAFGLFQPASEIRDHSVPSFSKHNRDAWKKFSGMDIPPEADGRLAPHYTRIKNFPMARVVPDNWPLLAYYRWHWKVGDGWNPWMDAMTAAYRKHIKVPFKSFYDPVVRVPPIWGNGGITLDYLNQWTYPYPEPFNISYVISEQMAMARRDPEKHKVISMVQGISYRSAIAPKGKKVPNPPAWTQDRPNVIYMTTPPDVMREALWAMFSRQMEGIGVYGWGALFDTFPFGKPKDRPGYQLTNPATRDVIREEMQRAAIPLGPLFRAVPERKPEVAVLESYASTIFANRGSWGWKGAIYHYGVLYTRAKLAPYVIYEEEIAARGIPESVKVLILFQCDVLTESAFKGIQEFQRRGGIVVSDKLSVPGIMADLPLPQYHRINDAKEDKENMLAACAELRKTLAPYFQPYADSDNPDLLPLVRTNGSADLLFVLNDRRDFGDYVGMYGLLMEKGMPNQGDIVLNRKSGAVYDLVQHKQIPFSMKNGKTVIPLEFRTNDGKALLVTAHPLKGLTLTVTPCGRTLKVSVTAPEKDVMRPIRLTVMAKDGTISDDSGYAIVKNGIFTRDVLLPKNGFKGKITVAVDDLATGKTITR